MFSIKLFLFFRVIIGIQFGAMTAGQVASFAPDYMKAKMAAGRILDLFDRTPSIDSYSDTGNKVWKFKEIYIMKFFNHNYLEKYYYTVSMISFRQLGLKAKRKLFYKVAKCCLLDARPVR